MLKKISFFTSRIFYRSFFILLFIFVFLLNVQAKTAFSTTTTNIDNIFNIYSQGIYAESEARMICMPRYLKEVFHGDLVDKYQEKLNKCLGEFQRGNWMNASAIAINTADALSYCYVKNNQIQDRTIFSDMVGRLVALHVLSIYKLNGLAESERIKAGHAMALLRYAKSHGMPPNPFLETLEKITGQEDVTGVDHNGPAIKMSSFEAVRQFISNKLKFKKKYRGKLLDISGNVHRVREALKNKIHIIMLGVNKDPDDIGFQHMIVCSINANSISADKAIDLDKGQEIIVSGVYRNNSIMGSIELSDCEIKDPTGK